MHFSSGQTVTKKRQDEVPNHCNSCLLSFQSSFGTSRCYTPSAVRGRNGCRVNSPSCKTSNRSLITCTWCITWLRCYRTRFPVWPLWLCATSRRLIALACGIDIAAEIFATNCAKNENGEICGAAIFRFVQDRPRPVAGATACVEAVSSGSCPSGCSSRQVSGIGNQQARLLYFHHCRQSIRCICTVTA